MPLDCKDAESIARELIAKIASEWTDTPKNRCVLENDSYLFILTLQTSNDLRLTRFDPNSPPSILHFNPLVEATEIVAIVANEVETLKDSELLDFIIRSNAESRIRQMLIAAPDVFSDGLWQLRIISTALVGIQWRLAFGRPDRARALIDTAVRFIEQRIRERFGPIYKGRNPRIHDFSVNTALRTFLPEYRRTGKLPSQNKFAKALGVTAKGWRDFLKNHNKPKNEQVVKEWLEELRKRQP